MEVIAAFLYFWMASLTAEIFAKVYYNIEFKDTIAICDCYDTVFWNNTGDLLYIILGGILQCGSSLKDIFLYISCQPTELNGEYSQIRRSTLFALCRTPSQSSATMSISQRVLKPYLWLRCNTPCSATFAIAQSQWADTDTYANHEENRLTRCSTWQSWI